jgi:hypothetical protein
MEMLIGNAINEIYKFNKYIFGLPCIVFCLLVIIVFVGINNLSVAATCLFQSPFSRAVCNTLYGHGSGNG